MQHNGYVLTLCRRILIYTSGSHTCTCIITWGAWENTGVWTLFPELLIQYIEGGPENVHFLTNPPGMLMLG